MILDRRQLIGVDLGSSTIKVGRFTEDGVLLSNKEVPTPQPSMPGRITIAICNVINLIDPEHQADFVGVALPGLMDSQGRVARVCVNFPGWDDVPLADWLEPRLGRRVTLGNDGNCALLGEAWRGAAIGFDDVLLLTLGTEVGRGVMLDGKIFKGHNPVASDPGLICVDPQSSSSQSGNKGSLLQFSSLSGLKFLSDLDSFELCRLAELGDAHALHVWEKYGRILGLGISSLIYLFTPQLVLLGGGLSAGSVYFLPLVRRIVEDRVQPISRKGLIIRECAYGNGAGRLGGARLALERLTNFGNSHIA